MDWTVPSTWLLAAWAAWLCQALFGWLNAALFDRRLMKFRRRYSRTRDDGKQNDVATLIIVPIKGADEHSHSHVFSLLNQNYPNYRLLFVVESDDDPAAVVVRESLDSAERAEGLTDAAILTAGLAHDCGQKVHNLLYALEHMRDSDEIIVFADADAVPGEQWLKRMVGGAMLERYGAATGYRWFIPDDTSFSSYLASVINSSVLIMFGPTWRNQAWGGSMSIRRSMLEECRLIEHWRGALSDDYQLSRAVRAAGKRIYFSPLSIVPSPAKYTFKSLLQFGKRQYIITRVYSPLVWLAALLFPSLYLTGWISSLVLGCMFNVWALATLSTVVVLDMLRGHVRMSVAHHMFDEATARRLESTRLLEYSGTPLWMAVHLWIVLSSAFGRRLKWANITYLLRGRQKVRILDRVTNNRDDDTLVSNTKATDEPDH